MPDNFLLQRSGDINKIYTMLPDIPEDIRNLTPGPVVQLLRELSVHQKELSAQNEALRRSQEALEISRTQYYELYNHAPVGYVTISEEGTIKEANLTLAALLGIRLKDLLKNPLAGYILPQDKDFYYLHRKKFLETGNPLVCEIRMIRKNGEWFWANIDETMKIKENGTTIYWAVISDISDRKQAEEIHRRMEQRLHQVEKAESLGRMAGAIAHQFNNLLGVVIGNLELSRYEILQGSQAQNCISEAMNAARLASEVSTLMLAYNGQTFLNRKPVNLVKLCAELLPLLTASLPKNVVLKTELLPHAYMIQADEMFLRKALINMVINAGESVLDQKGEIILSIRITSGLDVRTGLIFPPDWKPNNREYVQISVADNGCGIDESNLDKVFDPFFSTKLLGRGMGLAVVLGMAKAHDGAVSVESILGRGSHFHMFLPLLQAITVQQSQQMEPLPPPGTGHGLVLVVEDETALRYTAKQELEYLGHEVVTAEDGMVAIDVFYQHREKIICVLLDLTMPRKGGWETLAGIRAIRPEMPVILTSGYNELHVLAEEHAERPQVFLHKPYQLAELKAALGKAINLPRTIRTSVEADNAI